MVKISECHRNNLCVDCDSETCLGAGDPGADCPKWKCDMPSGTTCENCSFIKDYQRLMREEYRKLKDI